MGKDKGQLSEFGRILVLGLDGATFDVIDPLIEKGKLPNLEKLIREGCGLELLSTIHSYSAPAWSSFMTGMNPGKHGILDFTEHMKDKYKLKFLNASHREGKSLWSLMGEYGKNVGIMNVPFTYPPEEVNGFIISGMDAPSTKGNYVYPRGLHQEIMSNIGSYIIEVSVKDYIRKNLPKTFLEVVENAFELHMKTLNYLLSNKPWDLFVYVCRLTDQLQHYFWKYFDPAHPLYEEDADEELKAAVPSVYRKIDAAIGDLMTSLGEDTNVIVMSDHGHGGINGKKIYLNKWLRNEGFLTFDEKTKTVANSVLDFVDRETKAEFIDFLKKTIPRGVKDLLLKKAPFLKDRLVNYEAFSNIDWQQTRAYSDERRGNIWINVRGRQPKGIVAPGEEYESLREKIIARLEEMKDPDTQQRIFAEIYKKEDLYSGPHLEKAPDIVMTQGKRKYAYFLRGSNAGRNLDVWIEGLNEKEMGQLPNAIHRREGILIIKGRNVKKMGRLPRETNIMDVAPTLLYMMGLPIPEEMDGKILSDLFTKAYVADHPVTYTSFQDDQKKEKMDYNVEETELISERLKELGYL